MRSIGIVLLSVALFAGSSWADWLQFRGPGGSGISPEKNLPTTWSATENIVWKTELPGAGSSSPIVIGDKIVVTCYSGYGADGKDQKKLKRQVVCLSRDGKILWTREAPSGLPETNFTSFQAMHGYASSTPVSDGKNVFAFFGKAGVFAFDLEGKATTTSGESPPLWSASVGTGKNSWGTGTSPIIYKDFVIVNASVESGALIALKKSDGKVAWTAKGAVTQSWNTPILVNLPGGKTELVVSQQGKVRGFNPDTGVELWNCQGISDYVVPSVIAHDGVVYAIGARANQALAVRAGGKGNVSSTHVLWRIANGSNVSSPVNHDGHLYWASEPRQYVYCVKADKGTVVYEHMMKPNSGTIYASPLVADGKIYYVARTGGVYVLEASPKYKLLAHNRLPDGSNFDASPVADRGQLLLRSDRYLYCIGKK